MNNSLCSLCDQCLADLAVGHTFFSNLNFYCTASSIKPMGIAKELLKYDAK